ncbi:hypothetical protein MHF_1031 [Mycoplasma haemofelis Ohio2]|uniref:Uncharacterized protein n=1 Tax=Mycoplasma haemofelis (strain Ohio2) TaxID=859194 RepID=F6FJ83_MYCHI|nr:hypothetical protein MHF_1031 [Mycoplasma haemofelis Ohio2]
MASALFKGLVGTAATGTVATGGFLAFNHINKPTDVKSRLVWEGYTVADVKKDGVWKAIYLAKNKESGFSNFVSGSSKEDVGPKLKKKCSDLLSVSVDDKNYESSYKDAQKWCLKPELTTIEMQFDFEDRAFASSEDDFKNMFILYKDTKAFVDAVKSKTSSFANTLDASTAKSNIESWCNDMKAKAPLGEDLRNAKAWCTKPDATLNAFMDKQGFKPVPEEGWSSKFNSLKSKDTDPSSLSDVDGDTKLKEWCTQKNLGTAQIHSLNTDFEKAKTRCFVSK